MLKEISNPRQIQGEPCRRWFTSDTADLVVWFDSNDEVIAFQLCYDKPHAERAVTWRAEARGLSHMAVDDGEAVGMGHKASPILVPDVHGVRSRCCRRS